MLGRSVIVLTPDLPAHSQWDLRRHGRVVRHKRQMPGRYVVEEGLQSHQRPLQLLLEAYYIRPKVWVIE